MNIIQAEAERLAKERIKALKTQLSPEQLEEALPRYKEFFYKLLSRRNYYYYAVLE